MIGGAWRPTASQEDLLDVAVGPEAGVAAAWQRWLGASALETLDAGSARLLPLLMPRLHLLPGDDPARGRIAGAYRRAFYHASLLRARAARALAALHAVHVPTLVLKGGALGPLHYGDPALRQMNDFDALVPTADAAVALRALLREGWQPSQPAPAALISAYHGTGLRSADGFDFDLHWNLLDEAPESDADAPAWDAALPFDVMGVATQRLCASDLLVVVCAHGTHWSARSPVIWVADALAVLRTEGSRVDWARVAMMAQRWHVAMHLSETLDYLARRWAAPIPAATMAALRGVRTTRADRRAYALLTRMPSALDYLRRPWVRYRLRTRHRSAIAAIPGFFAYLRVTLGLSTNRALPREILTRFRSWRRDRAAGRR